MSATFDAFVRMFKQVFKAIGLLPGGRMPEMIARLAAVRRTSHNFGCGVGAHMDDLLAEYGFDAGAR